MIQCQNCGQASTGENNFCRFCGTKFSYNQNSPQGNFNFEPPKPYSWKTDEFQTAKPEPRKTDQINFPQAAQPPQNRGYAPPPPQNFAQNQPNFAPPQNFAQNQGNFSPPQNFGAQMQATRQNQYSIANFRCPRCGSQIPPRYERRVSQAGWIVFAVLLVVTGIFFWIGLLMREDVCVCSSCNLKIS